MTDQPKRPSWLSEGIAFTGNWEPLFMRRRAGRARVNEAELFLEEHSEATVKELAEAGVNLIITHFEKGGSLKEEAEEVELTRQLAEHCHRHGLKLGTYIRYDTLFTDILGDEPQTEGWARVMWDGTRPTYARQPFRKLACPTCEEHQQRVEEKVRLALEYVKADLIHFDGFNIGIEPATCRCARCKEAFYRYLIEKFGDDEERIKERFGHAHLDRIVPPEFHPVTAPFRPADPIIDPAVQEWVMFRWDLTAKIHHRLARLIRSINPEAAVEVNAGFSVHRNAYVSHGGDVAVYADDNDMMWTEDSHWAGMRDGALVSRIRHFKCMHSLGNITFSYIREDTSEGDRDLRLSFGQAIAFNNGSLGHVGSGLPTRELSWSLMRRWLQFFRSHADLLQGTAGLARVAVVRHRASLAFGGGEAYRGEGVAEQVLIQAHIPFDIVFDQHLEARIGRYRAVVLANAMCLSDREADVLRRYVMQGGGLVATEFSGFCDECRRERSDTVLRSLIGEEATPAWVSRNEGMFGDDYRLYMPADRLRPVRHSVQDGRVAYIPGASYQKPSTHIWALPPDWRDLERAVRWAVDAPMPILTDAPETVVCEPLATREGHRVVHLLNYDLAHKAPAFTVDVEIPEDRAVRAVTLLDPDRDGRQDLAYRVREGRCEISVPGLDIYGLVKVELA